MNCKFKFFDSSLFRCVDNNNIKISKYKEDKKILKRVRWISRQRLQSNLLKSNCEITSQPDWATIYIDIIPDKYGIDEKSLLKYIISLRDHNEFHEPTCERIITNLENLLSPKAIMVYCKYTRRGGLDINPLRYYDPNGLFRDRDLFLEGRMEFEREIRQ